MIGILHPIYLLMIIPAVILLILILKLDFLRSKDDDFRRFDRRRTKVMVMLSRIIIITCLFIALSAPYAELEVIEPGPPKLTILVDQSMSMELFDAKLDEIRGYLESEVPVRVAYIGRNQSSNIGEGILSNLEAEANILLLTDGYSNSGISLRDVMLEAAGVNASVSALLLEPTKEDASVLVLGDEKTFTEVEYDFQIRIYRSKLDKVRLSVAVDDKIVFEEETAEDVLDFSQKFGPGSHKITARISNDDYFEDNNVFYKSVHVIDKPRILFVSEYNDPIERLLEEFYVYDKVTKLPADLEPYYAVIIDDMAASKLNSDTLLLTNYLMDGNGMMLLGGFNSFDRGGYKNSLFETLLPVRVGSAERKKGDSNIVIVIDISGASAIMYEGKKITPLDITKALAVEVLDTLNMANEVGVVAFNDKAYKVSDIMPLYEQKPATIDKIKRLQGGGQSYFYEGLRGAYEMLKNKKGDRNIILLTDGHAFKDVQDRTASVVDSLRSLGINTYVVGVGVYVQDPFLQELAIRGEGIYFPADEANRLAILFGEPEEIKDGDDFSLFMLNPYHFITKDITLTALMTGYSEVVPKPAARMLVTTSAGTPGLTVWNYGVGRVATFNVYTGGNLGHLLADDNSLLVSRTVNWVIGDPERKQDYAVFVDDGFVDTNFKVQVKSDKRPYAEGFEFHKVERGLYESEEFRVEQAGFRSILNTTFAVNSEKEYRFVGFNPELEGMLEATGGKLFKDVEEIPPFVTRASRVSELKKVHVVWPFVLLAIIVFLVEIWLRKRVENQDGSDKKNR